MKNIKYLLGLLTVLLVMASCTTMQEGMYSDDMDNPRTQQIGNRVYMQDPYYGTVVLERDPYTGRYYDVTYGPRYGRGYYGNPSGGYYRTYPRVRNGRGSYNGDGNAIRKPAPSQREIQQQKEETRRKVLGN